MAVTELDFARLVGDLQSNPAFARKTRAEDELDRPERIVHLKALTQTIEGEIIPRLLLVFSQSGTDVPPQDGLRSVAEADVITFGEMLLSGEPGKCISYVELLRGKGLPLDTLFLNLFAPSARWLGTLWTQDLRSFTDVTIALGTLQRVFRHFTPAFEGHRGPLPGRRAFLVPAPGEQHTFGLFVVETFLHRAGWQVDTMPTFDFRAVQDFLRTNPVQLIGLSASCERFLEETSSAIGMMRQETADRGVVVMAGGKVFHPSPKLAQEVGADATAYDADETVRKAEELVPWPVGDEYRRRIN